MIVCKIISSEPSHLVLFRHGRTKYNKRGAYTGQIDIPLDDMGETDCHIAAHLCQQFDIIPTIAHESDLRRSTQSTDQFYLAMRSAVINRFKSAALREQCYGRYSGRHKSTVTDTGFHRGPTERPPGNAQYPGESLADCRQRVVTYYQESVMPGIAAGKRILISSHGNTLRALIWELDGIPDDRIAELEIPWAAPIIYVMDRDGSIRDSYLLTRDGIAQKSPGSWHALPLLRKKLQPV